MTRNGTKCSLPTGKSRLPKGKTRTEQRVVTWNVATRSDLMTWNAVTRFVSFSIIHYSLEMVHGRVVSLSAQKWEDYLISCARNKETTLTPLQNLNNIFFSPLLWIICLEKISVSFPQWLNTHIFLHFSLLFYSKKRAHASYDATITHFLLFVTIADR